MTILLIEMEGVDLSWVHFARFSTPRARGVKIAKIKQINYDCARTRRVIVSPFKALILAYFCNMIASLARCHKEPMRRGLFTSIFEYQEGFD